MSTDTRVYYRVPRSHRRFHKFQAALGYKPQYYFSFYFEGNFTLLNSDEYERVKEFVTRARVDTARLLECWSWK